jgi:ribosomal protein L11 methyltransferase
MTAAKTKEKWYAAEITAAAEAEEAIEFAFNELGAEGTEMDQLRRRPDDPVTVRGYFTSLPEPGVIDAAMNEALRIYGLSAATVTPVTTREVEQADWLEKWKQHWEPTIIGNFVITPPWIQPAAYERHVISIEPNMAFGTGTHETTQLCLAALERYFQPGDTVLDVGTGTGILAIAAAKLADASGHPSKVYACDTDADSVAIARENAMLNGVGEHIAFHEGTITEEMPAADIVCANLTLDVILPLLDQLLSKSKRKLILSGILTEQEPDILSALKERGKSSLEVTRDGEWIAVSIEHEGG